MTERILDAADRLFYGQGIRAVGVDAVAAEAGISKRSLYDYFPSKDDLIAAYLERRVRPAPASEAPAAEQLLGVFDGLERWFESGRFRGCPFVNAVTELGDAAHPGAVIAARFKQDRQRWFRDRLADLGVKDAGVLATQLMILVEGAMAAALVQGDPKMARAAKAAAASLLAAAGVQLPAAAAKRAGPASGKGSSRKR